MPCLCWSPRWEVQHIYKHWSAGCDHWAPAVGALRPLCMGLIMPFVAEFVGSPLPPDFWLDVCCDGTG